MNWTKSPMHGQDSIRVPHKHRKHSRVMVRVTVGRLYTFFPALQTLEGLGDEVADTV